MKSMYISCQECPRRQASRRLIGNISIEKHEDYDMARLIVFEDM
ncbi:hypothetical protein [Tissierella sp.]|nr:hypothetical protein [Tissierella sp.]